MTLVRLKFAVPEAAGQQPSAGALRWTPTKRRTAGDWVVMPAGFTVALVNGEATVEVDPTGADWVWRVDENVPSSQGGSRYVAVPDLEEIEYQALVAVDPSTLEPSEDPDPAWYAYVDTLAGQAATASASAVAAKVAAEAAELSATGSETSAAASAATATTKASEANTSATNAATSATTALGHRNDAAESAGAAANSETAAADSANSANLSAIAAAGSDTHATEMADIAQSSASDTIAAANGFSIGTVTTGTPGSPATATITGTAPDKRLNLGLPKGETGPANSLSVVETVTGPETAGATGPQGLKGDKGDPGGITVGNVVINNSDFNNLTADGIYRWSALSGASNAPANVPYGIMYVNTIDGGTRFVQTVYPTTSGTVGRWIVQRGYNGGIWSAWRTIPSSRVDQTAGRAIYQWDDLNQREQRIYGDTGWRTVAVTPVAGKVISGNVRYRRRGDQVELTFVDVLLDTAQTGYCEIIPSTEVPVGFRPHATSRNQQAIALNNNAINQQWITNFGSIAWSHATNSGVHSTTRPSASVLMGAIYWTTDENWPTTLPGTAHGVIQNL